MTKFTSVSAERANHAVATLCRVVGASVSGFYAWLRAIPAVGSVRNSVCVRSVERHGQARALVKRWPNRTANWALAMAHARAGILHSRSVLFKTR